jgi:ATP-dependent RNA helicase DDX35
MCLCSNKEPILPFALLNGMSDQERMFAIQPSRPKSRKVVVSTAYAETVPLEGIIYVVDCGLVKLKVFSPETCVDSLVVVPTSESGASRRSGRAGRTRPAKCFRLYTEKEFKTSKLTDSLEIERGNLTNMVYYLKSIGVDNLLHFDYITPPNIAQLSQALCTLNDMGLMSEDGRLVPSVANLVSQLPIDIYLSSLIVKSIEFGCTQEAIIIVGMLLVQSVFIESGNQTKSAIAKFKVQEGDLVSMINGVFD